MNYRLKGYGRFGLSGLLGSNLTQQGSWFSQASPNTGLHIGIASEGWGDINYTPTPLFYAFNNQPWNSRLIKMQMYPPISGIDFVETGMGEYRMQKSGSTWPAGVHDVFITASDGTDVVHQKFRLDIADRGYPVESNPMVALPSSPHASAQIRYINPVQQGTGDGLSAINAWGMNTFRSQAPGLLSSAGGHPIYIYLPRGAYWDEANAEPDVTDSLFSLPGGMNGSDFSPFVFMPDPATSGPKPKIRELLAQGGIKYCIFQDLEIEAGGILSHNQAGTDAALVGYETERLLFKNLDFTKDQFYIRNRAFGSYLTSEGKQAAWPRPHQKWATGNHGVFRHIEFDSCTADQPNSSLVDVLNLPGLDYDAHIHDCVFRDFGEEAVDFSGGELVTIENNRFIGSQNNQVAKPLHSQVSIQKLFIIRNNLFLRSNWDEQGVHGNGMGMNNCAGVVVEDNIFSSRYCVNIGDRDYDSTDTSEMFPFGAFMGNKFDGNLFHGEIQLTGIRHGTMAHLRDRNKFGFNSKNYYHSWTGNYRDYIDPGTGNLTTLPSTSEIMRFWDSSNDPDATLAVGTKYYDADFSWLDGNVGPSEDHMSDATPVEIDTIIDTPTFENPTTVGEWTWK